MDFFHSTLFLDLSVILHLLISVCTQFDHVQCAYITICYPYLNPFPLPRSIPLVLFRGHNLGFLTVSSFFYGDRLSACLLTPQPGGPDIRIYNLWTGGSSCTPRYRVPILIAFYDHSGL